MASNEPPFDDEDLIGDYYDEEEYDGPPPEYDEGFEDEIVGNGVELSRVEQLTKETSLVGGTVPDHGHAIMHEEMPLREGAIPPEVTFEENKSKFRTGADGNGAHMNINKEKNLYSFDRYNGSEQWRMRSSVLNGINDETMVSNEWKQRLDEKLKDTKENISKSSQSRSYSTEAQLVDFLNSFSRVTTFKNLTRSKTRSMRYQLDNDFPLEGNESTPITIGEGREVYINRHAKDSLYDRIVPKPYSKGEKCDDTGLLGMSISELTRRADAVDRRMEQRKLKMDECQPHDGSIDDSMMRPNGKYSSVDNQLWVDKYAPTHFADLLSDERINREVLRSLRQWDPYVFRREQPKRPISFILPEHDKSERVTESAKDDVENPKSKDIRPDEQNRVILLSGPPGVGKTTLAHIVAKHAGYRPLEVNASDERSAAVLKERISRAMDSSTLNLQNIAGKKEKMYGRPNCLILDEIDGADAKSSISSLVEMIRADIPTKGSKTKKQYLRRPIILICNHKFATVLRNLLPYARTFDVSPPPPNRLISRLKAILSSENMSIVSGNALLGQLVAGAGGDIRSCMYTLQFAASRAREIASQEMRKEHVVPNSRTSVIDISRVLNVSLNGKAKGMKDQRSDVIGTLSVIFRKVKKIEGLGKKRKSSRHGDVHKILYAVECFGDNSKTLDSLFLNLLNLSYVDPTLDRCWSAHEWLSDADLYRSNKSSVATTDGGALRWMQKQYIPSAAAAIHFLCRVETKPYLKYSLREMTDVAYSIEAKNGLISKFLEALSPHAKGCISGSSFTTTSLPYLLSLVSKSTDSNALSRPVSSIELLSKDENLIFDAHVAILRTLGLTYVKTLNYIDSTNSSHESYDMRLEPEIDNLVEFKGFTSVAHNGIANIPPILKELLAHAAHLEDMREREKAAANAQNNKITNSSKKLEKRISLDSLKVKEIVADEKEKDVVVQVSLYKNFLGLGASKAKAARYKRKAAHVSGFIKSKNRIKKSNTGTGIPLNQVIKFRFQKGFTQAIRLPCEKEDVFW